MDATTRRRLTRSIAMLAAAGGAAFVIGCGDDDEAAKDTPAAPAQPARFQIEATAEGRRKALRLPSSVKAGLVEITLKNSDRAPRSAQIVRIDGDHTVDDVLKIVDADEEGVKIPSWIQEGGGLGTVAPGTTATVTQVLTPGKWAIWDDEGGDEDRPGNSELGAKGEFQVTGDPGDAELPALPATVIATDEGEGKDKKYAFEFKGLKAGRNQVRFENTGDELHHALFFPMAQGATLEKVVEFFKTEGEAGGPPPVRFDRGFGTAVIDADNAQNVSLELTPGRYAVVCFISDREGGEPHAAKGMIEELTVE